MSFVRPSLPEIKAQVQADLSSRLDGATGPLLRRSMALVLVKVVAGAAHMLHGHLEYLAKQLFPDQSDDEFLVRQAALFGITKLPPTSARLTITMTGVNGSTVLGGTFLRRSDGAEYSVVADTDFAGTTAIVDVLAVTPGAAANCEVGTILTFESPVSGVNASATVSAVVISGTDTEDTDGLRARLLARMAEPPMGGTVADYVEWAKEVNGVTRVWVTPLGLGPGTVVVRFARDLDASPIPDAGEVAAVQAYLNSHAPAHAVVTAIAPVASPMNFTIGVVPNTSAMKNAVAAQIADLIATDGAPGGTVKLSRVHTAIGTTPGLTDYTLTVPSADTVFAANALPTLGTITWL